MVVKVQHAGIRRRMEVDLDILAGLAQLAEKLPELQPYRPQATVAEFRRVVRRELDFAREARNLQQFARNFARSPHVRIPRCYPELSTGRVLTMEWLDGARLCDPAVRQMPNIDLRQVARHGAEMYLEMIFHHGFYHGDPHPGNLVVLPDGAIGLLDFGMVGRLDEAAPRRHRRHADGDRVAGCAAAHVAGDAARRRAAGAGRAGAQRRSGRVRQSTTPTSRSTRSTWPGR